MANTKLPARLLDTSAIPALNVTGDLTVDTTTLKVDSTNNRVGIGIAAPGYPLEVAGASSTSIAYQRTGVSAKKWGFHTDNDNTYWQNITDSVLALTIKNNGNVGIGTTSPAHPLHITKELAGYQAYFNNDNGSAQGIKVRIKSNDSGNFNMLELVSASTGSDVTAMVVRDDGNVGIGDSPGTNNKFRIKGSVIGTAANLAETASLAILSLNYPRGNVNSGIHFGYANANYIQAADDSGSNAKNLTLNPFGGNVGIGTASPTSKLHIKAATNGYDGGILIEDTDSSTKSGITHVNGGLYLSSNATNDHLFISSAGDILIGNTTVQPSSQHNNQAGFGYDVSTSQLQIAATTNNAPMELSRNSSNDGNWITFRKQSNVLGNIGTYGGTLYIGSANGGIMFNGADIEPTSGEQTRADNTIDLGSTNYRFKDIFLGGGINFSANSNAGGMTSELLDDYEEGTFTPTLAGHYGDRGTTFTQGSRTGYYTKVGRQVTCEIQISSAGVNAANNTDIVCISGLPFGGVVSVATGASAHTSVAASQGGCWTLITGTTVAFLGNNGSVGAGWSWQTGSSWATVNCAVRLTITYTAS